MSLLDLQVIQVIVYMVSVLAVSLSLCMFLLAKAGTEYIVQKQFQSGEQALHEFGKTIQQLNKTHKAKSGN